MLSISLTFYQRVMLQNICGNHQVSNLSEASNFLRIIEKIRLKDSEILETEFSAADGNFKWKVPNESYGTLIAELENIEASALSDAINAIKTIRVNDAIWLIEVKDQLNGIKGKK